MPTPASKPPEERPSTPATPITATNVSVNRKLTLRVSDYESVTTDVTVEFNGPVTPEETAEITETFLLSAISKAVRSGPAPGPTSGSAYHHFHKRFGGVQ